jgi:hypothetical protein
VHIHNHQWVRHILAYLTWYHTIDPILQVSHLCHQGMCLNPKHLVWVQSLPPFFFFFFCACLLVFHALPLFPLISFAHSPFILSHLHVCAVLWQEDHTSNQDQHSCHGVLVL